MPFNAKQQDLEPRQIQSEAIIIGPQLIDNGRSKLCAACIDSKTLDKVNDELAQINNWELPLNENRPRAAQPRAQVAPVAPLDIN